MTSCAPEAAERLARIRASLRAKGPCEPPLLIGGIDLLRWALRKNHDVETAGLARLGIAQVRWWFESIRGFSFGGHTLLRTLLECTAGIPYLVGVLDHLFGERVGFEGVLLSEVHVRDVLESYDASFDRCARALFDGPLSIALGRREIELFQMVCLASPVAGHREDLVDVLVSPGDFASYAPGLEQWRGITADDRVPLSVLLHSGLLPSNKSATTADPLDRLEVVRDNDPALSIARVLRQCLST